MDNDTLITIAEKICQLWTACGGYGPPHEFKVVEWGRGTTKILPSHPKCRRNVLFEIRAGSPPAPRAAEAGSRS